MGKSLAEDIDTRWQMDLGDMKNQKVEHKKKEGATYSAFLVCIDCFSRQIWEKPLKQKTQEEVKTKLSQILKENPEKPNVISSDNGQEFQGIVQKYLYKRAITYRYKSVGDINALGLVDRAIQQLKLKMSEILSTNAEKTWVDVLPDAVKALNSYPKDVLHGAAPRQIRTDPQVRFMLLEDQAKNAETNTKLTQRRAAKLTTEGGFRAPLPESTSKFKRGAQATYGEVKQVASIQGSTVTDSEGGGNQHQEGQGGAPELLRRQGPLRGGERQAAGEEARTGRADHRTALQDPGGQGPDLAGNRGGPPARRDVELRRGAEGHELPPRRHHPSGP